MTVTAIAAEGPIVFVVVDAQEGESGILSPCRSAGLVLAIDVRTQVVTALARSLAMAPYIAFDATYVYWIAPGDLWTNGTLMRTRR